MCFMVDMVIVDLYPFVVTILAVSAEPPFLLMVVLPESFISRCLFPDAVAVRFVSGLGVHQLQAKAEMSYARMLPTLIMSLVTLKIAPCGR